MSRLSAVKVLTRIRWHVKSTQIGVNRASSFLVVLKIRTVITPSYARDRLRPGNVVNAVQHHDPNSMSYQIWRQYVPMIPVLRILTKLGQLNRSAGPCCYCAMNAVLCRSAVLVTEGVISQETVDRVLTIQRDYKFRCIITQSRFKH